MGLAAFREKWRSCEGKAAGNDERPIKLLAGALLAFGYDPNIPTQSDLSDSGYKGNGVLETFAAAAFIVVLSRAPNLCDTNTSEHHSSESGSRPVCQMSKFAVLRHDTMWVAFLTAPPLVEQ